VSVVEVDVPDPEPPEVTIEECPTELRAAARSGPTETP
jgi:hypothetical protein